MGLENVPRCQHVKTNGTQCGSPALRSRRYCYFHDKIRGERARIAANRSIFRPFDLPLLEDANAIQMALMKVIQMLGSGELDHKTAGLMLYALQTASVNLRHTDFEAAEVTDVIIDRDTVDATCINGPQWLEEDFETDEEEIESETGAEVDDEAEADAKPEAVAKPQAKPVVSAGRLQASADPLSKPAPKKAAKKEPQRVTTAEARKQVQSLARNWVLDTLAQKSQ
ncbi:MAG TPA: hypothetical protein VMX38_22360 [Verrucomicrobiae bacterium]|jgi:hypothetical protein|nr:hypothetical protein [Verrucomicrobiae bacterium]